MAEERVLVVDDGADMRDFVINYVLRPNGFDYLEARDGLEGFDLILVEAPDLILLDLQMPRLDGIGLLNKMHTEGINIPVILMTFYGSEEIAIEVFRLGVRDYVIKPFTEEELLEAIERALSEVRLRRERDSLTEQLVDINRDMQRYVHSLQSLYRVGKVITSMTETDTLMIRILEAAAYVVGAETAALQLFGEDGQTLYTRAVKSGPDIQLADEVSEDSLARFALQSGRPLAGEPYEEKGNRRRMVQLCAPLVIGGSAFGALSIGVPAETASEQHLNLLGGLADYAALGLDRVRLAAALGEA